MKNTKLTIKDISEMTGFSIRTVSRVINNDDNVKKETREIIEKTLGETGFQTNIFAKNLRKKSMNNIMVVIEKQKNTYPGQWYNILFQKIIDRLSEFNYNIFLTEYIPEQKEPLNGIQFLKSGFVDGAILFNIKEKDKKIKLFKEASIPFVTIEKDKKADNPYVCTDNFFGIYRAVEHLVNTGIKDIKMLIGNLGYTLNNERKNGLIKAFEDYNLKFDASNIISDIRTFKDTYEYCKNTEKLPEALIISGDEKAFGAIKALHERRIKIPEEISIIGYDNIPLSEFTTPALTTIEQPADEIAHTAADILINLIRKEKVQTQVTLPVKLIKRETTR
jgi:DNA-binding LacI/PurR family transcriptional regulator